MSKIIVRRQEYANNGTHANEIEAVVKQNLIANTLSGATDIAPSVGLLKSVKDAIDGDVNAINEAIEDPDLIADIFINELSGIRLSTFSPTTLNIPVANSYGIVLHLGWTAGQNIWIHALAFSTSGKIYSAYKTNSSSWSAWRTIV